MNEKELARLNDATAYIQEQFDESGDSAWLDGWVCGFTDPENARDGIDNEAIKEKLFDFLASLRK